MTWPVVSLSKIASIDRRSIDPSDIVSGTKYLGLEHIESGGRIIETQVVGKGDLASSKFKFTPEHILYGKLRPYLAKIALPDFSGICSTDILPIRPGKSVDRTFLAYFLRQPQMVELASSRSTGVNLPRLSPKTLAEFEVPFPPLAEQRRIAAILCKANAVREKRKQALSLADDLLKSSFIELFGDPADNPHRFKSERVELHLSKVRAGTQSGPFGAALKKHEYVEKGVPVWGVENVQQNQFIDGPKLFITKDKFEELRRYDVRSNDILISRAGTVGRMCVVPPEIQQSIISTNLVRLSLDVKSLLPEYFVGLFTYMANRLGALKANNKDNAFTFLNPRTLRALDIPIPPIDVQNKYRSITRCVKTYILTSESQLGGFSELSDALSQRAFRGEV